MAITSVPFIPPRSLVSKWAHQNQDSCHVLQGMRSCLGLRTRDLKLLLDDDARIAAVVVVMRTRRTGNHHVHRYGVGLGVHLVAQRGLRFQREVAQVLPEFAQLLEPARRVFGGVRGAGFVGDGFGRVGGAVLLPRLEYLWDHDGEGAADYCADHFGDGEDEEDDDAVCEDAWISE